MGNPDDHEKSTQDDPAAVRLARRKLLKLTVYGAPAIVGTFATRDASAATCDPNQGCPPDTGCQPTCNPSQCGPDTCKPAG
jgi:hypothetical protein